MAEGDEQVQLKFRIFDGTDIAHSTYSSSTTIGNLKERVVAEWPLGKTISPKSAGDVKLIHAGKVLENNKTLADCRITLRDVPGGVITMHVVVQLPVTKSMTDNNQEDNRKMNSCSCTIL